MIKRPKIQIAVLDKAESMPKEFFDVGTLVEYELDIAGFRNIHWHEDYFQWHDGMIEIMRKET